MGELVVKIKSSMVINDAHVAQNEKDLQWLYNFIVSEGKCCKSREGHKITCCHRDKATLNRFIISWPHSFVSLISFQGPSGIEHLLKSQPLCIYLANILGQLLDEVGIRKWEPSLAPWGKVSIMDAIEKKYSCCIFCSRDYNEELWRNINGANTPLCTHCCIGRLTACPVELLVLEAFSLEGVKWYNPHDLLSNHFLLCPITNKYASIVIMLDITSCDMKVVRQHNLCSSPSN